jgi:thiol:disulfide interchange protein DsbA
MVRKSGLLCSFLVLLCIGTVSGETFTEGEHYRKVEPEVTPHVGEGNVEIVELFWYGCPHCFDLEPYLTKWLEDQPPFIKLVRVPATLNPRWVTHARTFYALELIGELKRLHPLIFSAIHSQGRRLRDLSSITRFLVQQGVDEKKFLNAYNSFEVQTKLRHAVQLNREYGATGVPTLIVDGKYLTSASMAGSYDKLFKIMDFLAYKEVDAKSAKTR